MPVLYRLPRLTKCWWQWLLILDSWHLNNNGLLAKFNFSLKRYKNFQASTLVGLPKIFEVSIFNGHPWVWSKSWMYTKFWVPSSTFYHIAWSSLAPSCLLKLALGGRLRASGNIVKRWPRDPKLGIHSGFGAKSKMAIEHWDHQNLGHLFSCFTTRFENSSNFFLSFWTLSHPKYVPYYCRDVERQVNLKLIGL